MKNQIERAEPSRGAPDATWTEQTMLEINRLTPDIKGKAFDPDWFLLRQRFEQFESGHVVLLEALRTAKARLAICLSRFIDCHEHPASVEEVPAWINEAEAAIKQAERT